MGSVGEDVDEELPVRPQPAGDAPEQRFVVAHVFEHLDGNDAVETCSRVELVHVRRDELDPSEAPARQLAADELRLRARVRHGDDAAVWVALGDPQRQRAPAATKIEHVHAVGQLGAPAGELEHRILGRVEVAHTPRPVGAAVLATAAEHGLKERRRQRVVLGVGRIGMQRDRTAAQIAHEVAQLVRVALASLVAQAISREAADAEAYQCVGNPSRFGGGECRAQQAAAC